MLTAALAPTQSDVQLLLRSFLLDVLPSGTSVIAGQGNRTPEPSAPSFVVMTPIRFQRLDCNLDLSSDVKYTGSIAGTTMTVSAVAHGKILIGTFVYGVNVADNTVIQQQLTGATGGIGTYQISASQAISSQTLSSGYRTFTQNAEMTVQLDFHSADLSAGDMAQTASTLFRSEYGTKFFSAENPAIYPLYADDPTERPFINAENQYEWRWVLDAKIQVNQSAAVGQQFTDAVQIARIAVDEFYAP